MPMQLLPPAIDAYITAHTRLHDPLLEEMEQRAMRDAFPIIGPQVGSWLYLLTRLTNATRVYELGSGYGYSTWYFAKAVTENLAAQPSVEHASARVVHTVWDAALSADAKTNLGRAGFGELCEFIEGEAVSALSTADGGWDIIFMDIDKEGYPTALPVIEQKLRPGGLLLVDNMIWSGTVADPEDSRPSTLGIRALSAALTQSPRWQFLMLPLRDGLGIALFEG